MYSLDAKGLGEENPTQDKQWAHDAFAFYGGLTLRKNIMVPVFGLQSKDYSVTIYNDYTFAKYKNHISKIIVRSSKEFHLYSNT